jgi:hypothetical protein
MALLPAKQREREEVAVGGISRTSPIKRAGGRAEKFVKFVKFVKLVKLALRR